MNYTREPLKIRVFIGSPNKKPDFYLDLFPMVTSIFNY